jgi:hypothetical protein
VDPEGEHWCVLSLTPEGTIARRTEINCPGLVTDEEGRVLVEAD